MHPDIHKWQKWRLLELDVAKTVQCLFISNNLRLLLCGILTSEMMSPRFLSFWRKDFSQKTKCSKASKNVLTTAKAHSGQWNKRGLGLEAATGEPGLGCFSSQGSQRKEDLGDRFRGLACGLQCQHVCLGILPVLLTGCAPFVKLLTLSVFLFSQL